MRAGRLTGAAGLLGAALLVLAARRARLEPMLVQGESMLPTLRPGQRIAVGPLRRPPARGDLVVLREPAGGLEVVKRVVGLPGERVRLADGFQVALGPGKYLVLGDNRAASTDGRAFGPVTTAAMVGRVRFAYWPPQVRLQA
jgi:signal peptidase I